MRGEERDAAYLWDIVQAARKTIELLRRHNLEAGAACSERVRHPARLSKTEITEMPPIQGCGICLNQLIAAGWRLSAGSQASMMARS